MDSKKVIVIGGGASGLTAAIFAAREGALVTLLEQNEKPGKKISATGNGKCNLTNRVQEASCYRGEHPSFAGEVLTSFSMEDTLTYFQEIGLLFKEKNGYVYPRSEQASSVVEVLLREARRLKVKIKTKEVVKEILVIDSGYQVLTEGWHYEGERVILANGSCASALSGADGSGYAIAKSLGHTVVSPLPALVALRCEGKKIAKWAGVRTEGKVTLFINDEEISSAQGELQLTEYGISGIPVFQISRYAVRAIADKKKVSVSIDFFPEYRREEAAGILAAHQEKYGTLAKEMLLGILPEKLITVLALEPSLLEAVTNYRLNIRGAHSMEAAQVCSGGVSTEEISSKTMESKYCKGLYIVGELLDIDGACGGYNLQWAWASGAIAGMHAGK